jgi:glycolate oxidase iron-sulfur subunit
VVVSPSKAPEPVPLGRPSLRKLVDACVHCGFCLPACPTYGLWASEPDSPRGRIDLVRSVLDLHPGAEEPARAHLDACLGCLACQSACPSGVRYDLIAEEARELLEHRSRRPLAERATRAAIFSVFPYPRRAKVAATLAWAWTASGAARVAGRQGWLERLPGTLRAALELAPSASPASAWAPLPRYVGPAGRPRARAGLLSGCVASAFFAETHRATQRVLAAEGVFVVTLPNQGCCGALAAHTGRGDEARRSARALIETWAGTDVDVLVTNAAGCGSTLKGYGHLLGESDRADEAACFAAKVRDVTEWLAELSPLARRHPLPGRVAYHDACHLLHGQGIADAPRALLRAIPELDVVELEGAGTCCGSAGVYNLLQPQPAAELGRAKADAVLRAGVDAVVTANPGCVLQLRRYLPPEVQVLHPIEVLDASIARQPPPWATGATVRLGTRGGTR